jgi:hypothetical protein
MARWTGMMAPEPRCASKQCGVGVNNALRFAERGDYPILQLSHGFALRRGSCSFEPLAVGARTLQSHARVSSNAGRPLLALGARRAAWVDAGDRGLVDYDDAEDRFESNAD